MRHTGYKILMLIATIMFVVMPVCSKEFTIVIDPGHGGKDYGALGKITNEKSVNLSVAKQLGAMITKNLLDVKVEYTRNTDKYVGLKERAEIANQSKADLFISIHCNSLPKKSKKRNTINGASTYVLGLHRSAENLEVAMRENSVIEQEADFSTTYKGFDPNSSESYIIFEILQNQHLDSSINFADLVQKGLGDVAKRTDRGVKQAGFLVLAATTMPSVLIELDFICNPTVEKYLASKAGVKQMAKAIYQAVETYTNALLARENKKDKTNDINNK